MLLALLLAAQASNVPELPKDIPPGAALYTLLIMGQPAGQQAVWSEGKDLRAFFQFNDRGRGPKTYETLSLAADGTLASLTVDGNDYLKDAVHETFGVEGGVARWKNKTESGEKRLAG